MKVHETILKAKELIAAGDYARAREVLNTVLSNHVAIRLLEEIDAAELQKRREAAQAKTISPQALAPNPSAGIPLNASMLILGNMLFWALLLSFWFSPNGYIPHSFSTLIVLFSTMIGFYYLFVRRNWWMLAAGWTLLSIGLSIGGFVSILNNFG